MKRCLYILKNILEYPFRLFMNDHYFFYGNLRMKEYVHWYNHTWDNSRCIEIPIFQYYFKQFLGRHILEIGNVMNHYNLISPHDVLDKYEKGNGVINEDILTFKPKRKYDVILSVSTLEHVGFDDLEMKDPMAFSLAIQNIKENILTQDGLLIFSVPIGYNHDMDNILKDDSIPMEKICYLCVRDNIWVSCPWNEVQWKTGLLIGLIRNGYA